MGTLAAEDEEDMLDSSRSLICSRGIPEFVSRPEEETERREDTEVRDCIPNAEEEDAEETELLVLVCLSIAAAAERFCHEVGGREGRGFTSGVLVKSSEWNTSVSMLLGRVTEWPSDDIDAFVFSVREDRRRVNGDGASSSSLFKRQISTLKQI